MPEIRHDPLTGSGVIIAANRGQRPYEFEKPEPRRVGTKCPFCIGSESETPPELASYSNGRANHDPTWTVRVVPNKYPAVRQSDAGRSARQTSQTACPAFGKHEVIIESPSHKTCFGQLTTGEARLACQAYRDRLRAARETAGIKFAHVFKNMGPAAGATLDHVHSQLIALPAVPTRVSGTLDNYRRLLLDGDAPITSWLDQRLESSERVVERTSNLIAFCPYAARFPFETRIAPLDRASDFLAADLDLLDELADLLQRMVRRIEQVSGRAAYNFSLNVPPFESSSSAPIVWHLELFPRLSTPAGFEWATGWFINPIAPEECARLLRETAPGERESRGHVATPG